MGERIRRMDKNKKRISIYKYYFKTIILFNYLCFRFLFYNNYNKKVTTVISIDGVEVLHFTTKSGHEKMKQILLQSMAECINEVMKTDETVSCHDSRLLGHIRYVTK